MSRKTVKPGDEVQVFDVMADKQYCGIVESVLSTQFTYQPTEGGNIRFCPFSGKWHVSKEAPCETTPDRGAPNSDDDAKPRLSACAELTTSDQRVFEEAIRRTLGLPPLLEPSYSSKVSLGLGNE